MKTSVAILASIVASASAFTAPAVKTSKASTSGLQASAYDSDFGAVAPLQFFDPLGLADDADPANFARLREVEIRHGRCAMLAVVGWLTTAAGVRLPGMEGVGSGFKALTDLGAVAPEVRGVIPLTLGTVFFLTFCMQDLTGAGEFPGDYRNGYIDFGWDKQSDAWKKSKRTIELQQGRAAQMGILGIMVHEQLGNLNVIGLPQP
jgi:Chlorophyll A-B binding protein